tara:strand:- start:568 stop:939 length:372 start_codon:yes stop_codon:yes gene_type:complete
MNYKITEQVNYVIIEILESQLSESLQSNFKELLKEIKSKKIRHVILDMNCIINIGVSCLPLLLFGNDLFKTLGSFILCEIPFELEKIIKTNPSANTIDFLPTSEEAIESVMLTDLENMLKNKG